MRRIVSATPGTPPTNEVSPESSALDISLEELLGKTKVIIYREIRNLLLESSGGLLSKDSSQSLVNYVKLLRDLNKEDKKSIENLSDEDLEKIASSEK